MKRLIWKCALLLLLFFSLSSYTALHKYNNDFKQEFLTRINQIRQAGCKCGTQNMPPVPPLVWNEQLENAAAAHAKDMSSKHYFNHKNKEGRNIQDRIMDAGYTYKGFRSYAVGENIAYGQQSIEEVQTGWFKSEGHCLNLMNPDYREVGVARYNKYWVQDFGGRETFTPKQQQMMKNGAKVLLKKE